jgi:hypothetical protein
MITIKNFPEIYITGFLISSLIFIFRAIKGKPAQEPGWLDVFMWLFAWWFLLPIFIVRWIKYKIKGENI